MRVNNYVRCVRGGDVVAATTRAVTDPNSYPNNVARLRVSGKATGGLGMRGGCQSGFGSGGGQGQGGIPGSGGGFAGQTASTSTTATEMATSARTMLTKDRLPEAWVPRGIQ